jgi:hypothetical protein
MAVKYTVINDGQKVWMARVAYKGRRIAEQGHDLIRGTVPSIFHGAAGREWPQGAPVTRP